MTTPQNDALTALSEDVRHLIGTVEVLVATTATLAKTQAEVARAQTDVSISQVRLTSANKTSRRSRRVLLVVVVGLAGVVGVQYHQGQCFKTWANKSNARTTVLTPLSADRNKKLAGNVRAEHAALDYALKHPNGTPVQASVELGLLGKWNSSSDAFTRADDAYTKALAAHPVPPPPSYNCGVL